jgi:hypothetical protein
MVQSRLTDEDRNRKGWYTMWIKSATGDLVNSSRVRLVRVVSYERSAGSMVGLVAKMEDNSDVYLKESDVQQDTETTAIQSMQSLRDQLFLAIANGQASFDVNQG